MDYPRTNLYVISLKNPISQRTQALSIYYRSSASPNPAEGSASSDPLVVWRVADPIMRASFRFKTIKTTAADTVLDNDDVRNKKWELAFCFVINEIFH